MMIDVQNLTKIFETGKNKNFTAVNDISFHIQPGERIAFIGPNGAGKSTTLKMLTGILYPTSGNASVAGFVPWKDQRRMAYEIGIVFGQRSQLWYQLPVSDSFDLLAKLYGVAPALYRQRIRHLIDVLQIQDLVNQPVKSLSLGQRMRCEIAASLIHKPKILFLDEPTIGLDIMAKALLREHLKHLAETEETTIVLTSHDTGDIEEICQRVILINHGAIMLDKPLSALRRDVLSKKQITIITDEEKPMADFDGVLHSETGHHQIKLSVDQNVTPVNRIITEALQKFTVRDLLVENAPLEEIIRDLYETKSAA